MPGRDGTGPFGLGNRSGRGMGPCGRGLRGAGRGLGRLFGFGAGTSDTEVSLEREAQSLQSQLDAVRNRLESLKSGR